MKRTSIENIINVSDFVEAFNNFLKETDYGFVYNGNNPFKIDSVGRRNFRVEEALNLFSYSIDGFEGDIIDLEEWFESLEGFDELKIRRVISPFDRFSPQEKLLAKLNHLYKLSKFEKFTKGDTLEAYEKAKNELPMYLENEINLISVRDYTIIRLPESKDWLMKEKV